jgi:hypothetical protein
MRPSASSVLSATRSARSGGNDGALSLSKVGVTVGPAKHVTTSTVGASMRGDGTLFRLRRRVARRRTKAYPRPIVASGFGGYVNFPVRLGGLEGQYRGPCPARTFALCEVRKIWDRWAKDSDTISISLTTRT